MADYVRVDVVEGDTQALDLTLPVSRRPPHAKGVRVVWHGTLGLCRVF